MNEKKRKRTVEPLKNGDGKKEIENGTANENDNENEIKFDSDGTMIKEGKARVYLGDEVFYNPRMKFCRDMDMLVFSHLPTQEYLDALSATGIRGIRAVLEPNFNTIFNDRNWRSCKLIRKNLELNEISAEVQNKDASILLRERLFEHVDIDPFGSPTVFVDSACFSATRFLSVTATDTAALCGSAEVSGLRKYSAFAKKVDCYPEVGLRILIGKIAREATKYDKGIDVILSWAKEHYYRAHVRIRRSVSYAGKSYRKIGYLFYCDCGGREWATMLDAESRDCECGKKYSIMGPLWLGELHDSDFVDKIELELERETGTDLEERYIGIKEINLLKRVKGELNIPFHYDVHEVSRLGKASPPSMEELERLLSEKGYLFSRTRFSGTSFKTDAKIREILKLLKL